jgi:ERCC4-type nuclease
MTGVVVDVFERESRISEHLRALGVPVEMRSLANGDYVVGASVIERKTARDLGSAIVRGRFWPQIGRLRKPFDGRYLLVEGLDLEESRLRPQSIRGILLTVGDLGFDVVRSADPADSAMWLAVLARRPTRTAGKWRPRYAQRPNYAETPEAMLASVPGISSHGARALLNHFGNVQAVVNAAEAEWLSVPGIGPKKAAALAKAIRHTRRPS